MAERKTGKKKAKKPVIDLLPELRVNAPARHDDFIVTGEKDPDSASQKIPVLSGKFVIPCMLQELPGQAEAQRDEDCWMVSGKRVEKKTIPGLPVSMILAKKSSRVIRSACLSFYQVDGIVRLLCKTVPSLES